MLKPSIAQKVCAGAVSLALVGTFGPTAALAADAEAAGAEVDGASQAQEGKDLSQYTLYLKETTYAATGKVIKPKIDSIFDGDDESVKLPKGSYTITYSKDIEGNGDEGDEYQTVKEVRTPGNYRMSLEAVEGSGYINRVTAEFSVYAVNDINLAAVAFANDDSEEDPVFSYTGKSFNHPVQVELNGKQLNQGTDYTVSYFNDDTNEPVKDPIADGNYRAIVTGVGKYQGEVSKFFEIDNPTDFARHADFSIVGNSCIALIGKTAEPQVRLMLKGDKTPIPEDAYTLKYTEWDYENDGTIVLDGAPDTPGDYEVYAEAKPGSGYSGKTDTCSFTVVSAEDGKYLSNAYSTNYWSSDSDIPSEIAYTGQPVNLGLNYVLANGQSVEEGVDYDLSYEIWTNQGNETYKPFDGIPVDEGDYLAVVTGKSDKCEGSLNIPFLIVKNKPDAVDEIISNLPDFEDVKLADEPRISTAQAAYDNLSDEAKNDFGDDGNYSLDKLTEAKAGLNLLKADPKDKAAVDNVIDAINAIDDDVYDDGCRTDKQADEITKASNLYDNLNDGQRALVIERYTDRLDNAKGYLKDYNEVKKVVDQIKELPSKVTSGKAAQQVQDASDAYDDLWDTNLVPKNCRDKLDRALAAKDKYEDDVDAAEQVEDLIWDLSEEVTTRAEQKDVIAAQRAYNKLTKTQKGYMDKDAVSALKSAVKSADKYVKAQKAKAAAARKAVITVNSRTVNAKVVDKAVKKVKSSKGKVKTIVLGKNVKKVSKSAFKKYKKATTLQVKTKKLTKKSVKGSLKGSKVKTVQVKVGNRKANKKQAKKYAEIFTKANAGKKVKVTWAK